MKVKLVCDPKKYKDLESYLSSLGLEISSDADFVLTEEKTNKQFLLGQHENDTVLIKPSNIIFIESQGADIIAHTTEGKYFLNGKLYEFDGKYHQYGLIRIHRSFIVNINHIKSISTSFNSKFMLKLSNGDKVEVSRTYYHMFKEYVGL